MEWTHQEGPELHAGTITWHTTKYKLHQLHRRCILTLRKTIVCGPCPVFFCWVHIPSSFSAWSYSSGAVWESRWTSWAVRPNEPYGFLGHKDLLNRASALVTSCPWYVTWHLRTLSNTSPPPPLDHSDQQSFAPHPLPPSPVVLLNVSCRCWDIGWSVDLRPQKP